MKKRPFTSVIIAAGGRGSRMGADINKIFLDLYDKPIIAYTMTVFEKCADIDEIIISAQEYDMLGISDIIKEFDIKKVKTITKGGAERQNSVYNALHEVSEDCEIILVHDAARPLVTEDEIGAVVDSVIKYGTGVLGSPCVNTIKRTDSDGFIVKTLDRNILFEVRTPQGFKRELLFEAYENAIENNLKATDDSAFVEAMGIRPKMVSGSSDNIKITTYEDIFIAEQILQKRGNDE